MDLTNYTEVEFDSESYFRFCKDMESHYSYLDISEEAWKTYHNLARAYKNSAYNFPDPVVTFYHNLYATYIDIENLVYQIKNTR